MSSLGTSDKQILEKLFQMSGGYVLNFTDRSFGEFFRDDVGVSIDDEAYQYASRSKANRMRRFWQLADDHLVGTSIVRLTAYINTQSLLGKLNRQDFPEELMGYAQRIAARLLGSTTVATIATEDSFIAKKFDNVSIKALGLDRDMNVLLQERIEEITTCLRAEAPLAVIFLCGSCLEGIILGIARTKAKDFNQSLLSPKDKTGKTKAFYDCETGGAKIGHVVPCARRCVAV